jgi:hypothetical protein
MTGTEGHPPWTNRGGVRPDDRECGGIDYLKLTVWGSVALVKETLELGILDRYAADPRGAAPGWPTSPGSGRTSAIHHAGLLDVVEYTETVTRGDEFCSVEVKGLGCGHFGNSGMQRLMKDLQGMFRCRASRVDVMAHTTAFSPRTAYECGCAGSIRSRSVMPEQFSFHESSGGTTCVIGLVPKPGGGMKRSGDRILRAYDLRGPTRVELESHGDYADGAAKALADAAMVDWPRLIRGMIRQYVDFVNIESDARPTRRTLLPWWEAFVEDAEKIGVAALRTPSISTAIGAVDGILQRHSRWLLPAIDALGDDWLLDRIRRHGNARKGPDHQDRVSQLETFRGTGIAGAPDIRTPLPF